MRARIIPHSLRFKVTVGIMLPVLLILTVASYLQYTSHRDLLTANLHRSATNAGEIVKSSLQDAMLTNDFSTLRRIMDDIAQQEDVQDLMLLDNDGYVVVATQNELEGRTIPLSDPTCQACHGQATASLNSSVIVTAPQGGRTYRNVNAIENRPICHTCHSAEESVNGVLVTNFSMADVDRQLAATGRVSLVWSAASILLAIVVTNIMMSQMVVSRVERFVRVIREVDRGDLDQRVHVASHDEIGEMAQSFNQMVEGLKEKEELERQVRQRSAELQVQAARLATLNTVADTVSQSLDLDDIMDSALDKVLELMGLSAGWIVLRGGQENGGDGEPYLAACRGPNGAICEEIEQAWQECICPDVLRSARIQASQGILECPRLNAATWTKPPAFQVCVPLESKHRVLGVMTLLGDGPVGLSGLGQDALETLTAVGQQVGIAIENASLYAEVREKEALRRQLLERVIAAQEEERQRIARELHDETSQALTSLLVQLRILQESRSPDELKAHIEDMRAAVARTLEDVHGLALELRPSVLDDLGLVAALRRYLRGFESKFRLPVDFQVLGPTDQRLPEQVETALYRIAQEALINVARHAQATRVSVLLENRGPSVVLIVEDDGQGFEVGQVMGPRLQERNLGLHGMRERASLLGGTVVIESTPGQGTAVFAELPLAGERDEEVDDGQDPAVVGG